MLSLALRPACLHRLGQPRFLGNASSAGPVKAECISGLRSRFGGALLWLSRCWLAKRSSHSSITPRLASRLGQPLPVFKTQGAAVLVERAMLRGRHRLQVLGAVVITNLILVMYMLGRLQSSTVGKFPVQSVLKDVSLAAVMLVRGCLGMLRRPNVYIPIVVITLRLFAVRQIRRIGVMAMTIPTLPSFQESTTATFTKPLIHETSI